jgi:hypothetical protein
MVMAIRGNKEAMERARWFRSLSKVDRIDFAVGTIQGINKDLGLPEGDSVRKCEILKAAKFNRI